ncbi:hypothetical protein BKK79_20155 [Cupriavidus sp. USMAA2-4]|nr:hypothetical protein BKK79_19795 [Cupriavidus sp. USMAA2-4]AOY93859.1 hypothetical protein BKK79_20155 [Cupriavidus sp. USMAA2-4]
MRELTLDEFRQARAAMQVERYPGTAPSLDDWETVMVAGVPVSLRRPRTPVCSPEGLADLFPCLVRKSEAP